MHEQLHLAPPNDSERYAARSVLPSETDEMLELMSQCFSLDIASAKPIFFSDPFFNLDWKRALFDRATSKMLSCLTVVPTTLRLGLDSSATLTMAGIAGVCTDPPFRGQGHARRLLSETIEWLGNETEFCAACLTAELPQLYESLGWACCGRGVHWTARNCRALPASDESRHVRLLTTSEVSSYAPKIRALYARSPQTNRPGSFARDDRRWRCIERLTNGRRVAIYERGGVLSAYCAFDERLVSDTRTGFIHEMVALDEVGRHALVGFLSTGQAGEALNGECRESDLSDFGLLAVPGLEIVPKHNLYIRPTNMPKLAQAFAGKDRREQFDMGSWKLQFDRLDPYLAPPDTF